MKWKFNQLSEYFQACCQRKHALRLYRDWPEMLPQPCPFHDFKSSEESCMEGNCSRKKAHKTAFFGPLVNFFLNSKFSMSSLPKRTWKMFWNPKLLLATCLETLWKLVELSFHSYIRPGVSCMENEYREKWLKWPPFFSH